MDNDGGLALVLSGGGARAAYQVGALRGIAERAGSGASFPIVTGVSAGAINAAGLASGEGSLDSAVSALDRTGRRRKDHPRIPRILQYGFCRGIRPAHPGAADFPGERSGGLHLERNSRSPHQHLAAAKPPVATHQWQHRSAHPRAGFTAFYSLIFLRGPDARAHQRGARRVQQVAVDPVGPLGFFERNVVFLARFERDIFVENRVLVNAA